MLESVQQAVEYVQSLPPEDRPAVQTWLVMWGITSIFYYLVVGFVVWRLGRRIIAATIAAFREARLRSS